MWYHVRNDTATSELNHWQWNALTIERHTDNKGGILTGKERHDKRKDEKKEAKIKNTASGGNVPRKYYLNESNGREKSLGNLTILPVRWLNSMTVLLFERFRAPLDRRWNWHWAVKEPPSWIWTPKKSLGTRLQVRRKKYLEQNCTEYKWETVGDQKYLDLSVTGKHRSMPKAERKYTQLIYESLKNHEILKTQDHFSHCFIIWSVNNN